MGSLTQQMRRKGRIGYEYTNRVIILKRIVAFGFSDVTFPINGVLPFKGLPFTCFPEALIRQSGQPPYGNSMLKQLLQT
jgi:hypothetical protein